MTLLPEQEDRIRRYLLGDATPNEAERVETDLLRGDESVEHLRMIEDELITDYARDALIEREMEAMAKNFFITPERRERLMLAREMVKEASAMNEDMAVEEMNAVGAAHRTNETRQEVSRKGREWLSALFQPGRPRWMIAVYATLLIGLGLGMWRLWRGDRENEVNARVKKGMAALNQAYREQRLVRARITELQYAPYRETRGGLEADGEQSGIDLPARRRAYDSFDDAIRENPNAAAAHHAMGRFHLARKRFDDAIAEFEAALKTAPNDARLHSDLGAALMEKSNLEALQKSGRDSRTIDRSLEHLNRAIELDGSLLEPLFNRASLRQSLELLPQAKADWEQYLRKDSSSRWAKEAQDNLELIKERGRKISQRDVELFNDFLRAYQAGEEEEVWRIFCRSHFWLGNHIAARLIDETLALARDGRIDEAQARWRMLNDIGALAERRSGDRLVKDLALVYHPASIARANALALARDLMKGAFKNSESGAGQVIERYEKAGALFHQYGDVAESLLAELWRGICYLQQAETQRGLTIFSAVARASEARQYKWLQSLAFIGAANAQERLAEYSSSIASCNRAHQLSEEIADGNGSLRSLYLLSALYGNLGKFHESWRIAQQGLELAGQIKTEQRQIIGFYFFSAKSFNSQGLYSAALDYANETLQRSEEMNSAPMIRSRYLVNTGLIYIKMGRYKEAVDHIKRGMEIGQTAQPNALARELTAYAAFFLGQAYRLSGATTQSSALIEQAADFCREKDNRLLSHMVAKEKLMVRIARGETEAIRDDLRPLIAAYEDSRAKILEESNRNSFFAQEQSVYDIAIAFDAATPDTEIEAFECSETSRARTLLDAFRGRRDRNTVSVGAEPRFEGVTSPLHLDEIQSRMPARAQILQYAALEEKLIIWLITPRRFKQIIVNVPLVQLTRQVTDFLALVSRPGSDQDRKWEGASGELYNILFQPVAPLLDPDNQICVVADKILNRLPYGALVSPVTGKPVIVDYLLTYAPSASLFTLCSEEARNRAGAAPEYLLSIGNPSFDRHAFPNLDDLPAAAREAEAIIAFYPPPNRLLIGAKAKKNIVVEEMKRSQVIHLATHYDPDPITPLNSRLALSAETEDAAPSQQNSALLTSEIYNLNLRQTRLAVLSACQTWAEDYFSGEGAVGVSRPFLASGIPLVVSSLWRIDSPATKELMVAFHRLRKTPGTSTAQALRTAQLGFLSGSVPPYRHPYYWAAFILIGGQSDF